MVADDQLLFDLIFKLVENATLLGLIQAALETDPELAGRVLAKYGELPARVMPEQVRKDMLNLLVGLHEDHFDA